LGANRIHRLDAAEGAELNSLHIGQISPLALMRALQVGANPNFSFVC
jgi:hypothetical protein